jgi:hypothetical protein
VSELKAVFKYPSLAIRVRSRLLDRFEFAVLQRVIASCAQGLKIDVVRKRFLTQSSVDHETT